MRRRGLAFHIGGAAVPTCPTGRNVLVQCLESAESGDAFSCSPGRKGAPREARPPQRATPRPRGP
eukprot:6295227-Alexandrium_andersonii.AAC.1